MDLLGKKCVDELSNLVHFCRERTKTDRLLFDIKFKNSEKDFKNEKEEREFYEMLTFEVKETVKLAFIVDYIQSDNEKYKIAFNEFETFSWGLNESTLTLEEKMKIIFEMCNKNLELLELEGDAPIYDLEKIIIFRSLSLNELEMEKLFSGGIFSKVIVDGLGLRTRDSQKIEEKSNDIDQNFILDDQQFLANSKIVKDHYLDKMDSYTVEDVEKIIRALERLDVIDDLCQSIKKKLLANVHKRLSKQALNKKQKKDICGLSEEFGYDFLKKDHKADPKERDRIYRKAEEAIDLLDMTFRDDRYVSVGEKINWVSKLLRLGTNRQDIEKLLRDIDFKSERHTPSIFSFYLNNRGKLVYFANKYGLDGQINELDDYFLKMKTASDRGNEEDYQFWKQKLEQKTLDALSWIPKIYIYEFARGEKLCKENQAGKIVKIRGRNNPNIWKKKLK